MPADTKPIDVSAIGVEPLSATFFIDPNAVRTEDLHDDEVLPGTGMSLTYYRQQSAGKEETTQASGVFFYTERQVDIEQTTQEPLLSHRGEHQKLRKSISESGGLIKRVCFLLVNSIKA